MNIKCACVWLLFSFFSGFYEVVVCNVKLIRFNFSRNYNSQDFSNHNDGEVWTIRFSDNEESYSYSS